MSNREFETEKVKTCLMYRNDAGKFAALDHASGGYPYKVEIDEAQEFTSLAQAERCRWWEVFRKRNIKRILVKTIKKIDSDGLMTPAVTWKGTGK